MRWPTATTVGRVRQVARSYVRQVAIVADVATPLLNVAYAVWHVANVARVEAVAPARQPPNVVDDVDVQRLPRRQHAVATIAGIVDAGTVHW